MAKKKPTPPATEAADVSAQPYYLQRAHIKDFRSIRDAKVEFKPGLNIIIGANGSGKTNFVQRVSEGLSWKSKRKSINNSAFFINGKVEIEIEYIKQGFDYNKLYVGLAEKQEGVLIKLTSKNKVIESSGLPLGLIKLDSLHGGHLFDTVLVGHGLPEQYTLIKNAGNLSVKQDDYDFGEGFSEIFNGSIAWDILEDIPFRNKATEKDIAGIKRFIANVIMFHVNWVKPDLLSYTPIVDVRIAGEIQVYYNSVQNELIINGLILDFKIGEDWLPFNALSSGTQRLFYIVSEVAVLNIEPLHAASARAIRLPIDRIILVEEPELGIHPDQLHKLLLFLREQSEKHQIIITTHSPQVLDMLNDDELDRITICELDEKKGTQFRKLKKTQIATAKKFMQEQGLFLSDYWRYGNLEGVN